MIIENEKKCVNRANKNDYCNRDCYNCELVKTDIEILTALDMAMQALSQEPAYCDRNICLRNEYNGIGCDECEVTKSQESNTVIGTGDGAYYRIKALQAQADGEKSFFCSHCGERLENEN